MNQIKYLLCIPLGGFSDVLCQIEKCYIYCKKFNRKLIIDLDRSYYNINFDEYFYLSDSCYLGCVENYKNILLEKNTTFPKGFEDENLFNFKITYDKNIKKICLYSTKEPIDFDFNYDYKEKILIYNQWGYGSYDLILSILGFKQNILTDFIEKYNKIPKPYMGFQVRNTDYKSDYKSLIKKNKNIIIENKYHNIFLATDDKECLNYFNKIKNIKVYNFTTFPENKIEGIGLHYPHYYDIKADTKIKDLVSDLFLLSFSEIIISESLGNYIKLARYFYSNREKIIKIIKNEKLSLEN